MVIVSSSIKILFLFDRFDDRPSLWSPLAQSTEWVGLKNVSQKCGFAAARSQWRCEYSNHTLQSESASHGVCVIRSDRGHWIHTKCNQQPAAPSTLTNVDFRSSLCPEAWPSNKLISDNKKSLELFSKSIPNSPVLLLLSHTYILPRTSFQKSTKY